MKRIEFKESDNISVNEISDNRISIGIMELNGEPIPGGELIIHRSSVSELMRKLRWYSDDEGYIIWSVEDFESAAEAIEENKGDGPDYPKLFDRSKFKEALDRMINKHDCTIGITWDTIDWYLHQYCKLEE